MLNHNRENLHAKTGSAKAGVWAVCLVVVPFLLTACGDASPWERHTDVTDSNLEVVYYDGAGTAWIGGRLGTLIRYEGEGVFEPVETGTLQSIRAIHGSGPGDVWIAGDGGLLLRYDGLELQQQDAPTEDDFEALWVFSSSDIFLLTATKEYRGAPGAWVELDLDGTFDTLWAFGPNDIWLIQSLGDFAHWNGTTWESVDHGLPGVQLWYDVWGTATEFWVVGSYLGNDADWVLHYAGGVFEAEQIDWVGDVHATAAITGTGPTDLYRVGSFGFSARFDGTRWKTIAPPYDYDIVKDVAVTATEVIAICESGVVWTMPR
ncbi:MAG: hypothetical protein ABI333_30610 [bacterium]